MINNCLLSRLSNSRKIAEHRLTVMNPFGFTVYFVLRSGGAAVSPSDFDPDHVSK